MSKKTTNDREKKQNGEAEISKSMKSFLKSYQETSKDAAEEYRTKHTLLQLECERLRIEKDELKTESSDVIKMLRQQLESKDRELESLKKEKAINDTNREQAAKNIEYALQNELIHLKTVITEKEREIKALEEELELNIEYKNGRNQYNQDIEYYKSEIERRASKEKEKISKLEKKFYDEKINLQKQFQQKWMDLRKSSHEEAVTKLGETTKQLFVENRSMTEELQLQLQATEKLKIKQKQLNEENKRLIREVELQEEKEKEYASQHQQRKSLIKKLSSRINELEENAEWIKNEQAKSTANASLKVRRELEDSKLDIEGLKKLLELKTRELKKIKRLARNVLEQRTQLEQFFLDAIDDVRSEIWARRNGLNSSVEHSYPFVTEAGAPFDSLPSKSKFPVLSPRIPSPFSVSTQPSPRKSFSPPVTLSSADTPAIQLRGGMVDVKDLTWEDKERVLRMLFARMNGVKVSEN